MTSLRGPEGFPGSVFLQLHGGLPALSVPQCLSAAAGVGRQGQFQFSLSFFLYITFTASVLPRQVPGGLRQLHLTEWPGVPPVPLALL